MDESNIEEGRLNSILKSRNRFPLHEVQGFFPEDDTVTTTFTRNRRVSFGRKCVKEFQIGSAVSTQALDEYEQSASFSDPSECSGPLDLALSKTCQDPEIEENKEDDLITPPECFSDSKLRAPEDRARLFTENCISIAKSVFQDTETELTAIIIGAKPTITDDERKNMSNVNFSTLDISHDFIPVRHPELMFSEQSHPVDKSRFDFLDHPTTNKLGMKTPRQAQRTPLARIATPWDDENDENIPPAHRSYRQVSTPIHREFLSDATMEFTCANMKANRQQIISNNSVNYGSDMEETCGRRLANNTQRSLDMSCTRGAWNNVFDDNEDEDDEDPLKLDAPRDDFLADLSGLDKTVTPSDTEDSPFGSIQKELANLSVANKSFRDRFELNSSNRSILFSPAPASPLVLSPCVDPLLFTPTCSKTRINNDDMEMTEARPIPALNPNDSCNVTAVLTPCSDLPFSPTCVNMHFKTGENDMEITEVVRRPVNLSDDSLLATSLVISPNGPITPIQFSPTCQNIKLPGVEKVENDEMEITTIKNMGIENNDNTELKDSGITPLSYAPTPMRKSKISPAKELNFVIAESSHETSEPSKAAENYSENRVDIELVQSQQDEIISENEVDMDITQVNPLKCSDMISEILSENLISESEKEVELSMKISNVNHSTVEAEVDIAVTVGSDVADHNNSKGSDETKVSNMDITQVNHVSESEVATETEVNLPISVKICEEESTKQIVECSTTTKENELVMEINQTTSVEITSEISEASNQLIECSTTSKETQLPAEDIDDKNPIIKTSTQQIIECSTSNKQIDSCMEISQIEKLVPGNTENCQIENEKDPKTILDNSKLFRVTESETTVKVSEEDSNEDIRKFGSSESENNGGKGESTDEITPTVLKVITEVDTIAQNVEHSEENNILCAQKKIEAEVDPESTPQEIMTNEHKDNQVTVGITEDNEMDIECVRKVHKSGPKQYSTSEEIVAPEPNGNAVNTTAHEENYEMDIESVQKFNVSEPKSENASKEMPPNELGLNAVVDTVAQSIVEIPEEHDNMDLENTQKIDEIVTDKTLSHSEEISKDVLKCSVDITVSKEIDTIEEKSEKILENCMNESETEKSQVNELDSSKLALTKNNSDEMNELDISTRVTLHAMDKVETPAGCAEEIKNCLETKEDQAVSDDMEMSTANCANEAISPVMPASKINNPNIAEYSEIVEEEKVTEDKSNKPEEFNTETDSKQKISIQRRSQSNHDSVKEKTDASSWVENSHKSILGDENQEIELGIQRLEITEENTHVANEDYTYTVKSNCEKTYTVEINDETKVLENSLKNKRQTYVIPEKRPHSDSPCQNQRLKKNRVSDSPMPLRRSARLDASLNRSKTETSQLSTPKSLKKETFGKRIHSDSPLIGDASLKKGRPSASPLVARNLSALMDNDISYAGPTRFSANLETSITLQDSSIENESNKELSVVLPETVNAVSSTMDNPENSPQTSESVAENNVLTRRQNSGSFPENSPQTSESIAENNVLPRRKNSGSFPENSPQTSESVTENILSPRRRNSNVSFGAFSHEPSVVIHKPSFIIEDDIQNDVPLAMNTLRENSITVPNLAVPDLDDEDFAFEHDVSSSTKKIDDLFKKSMVLNETNGDVTSTNMSIIDEILKLPHSIDLPNISNINSTRNVSNTNCKEDDDNSKMEGVETDLFEQTHKNVRDMLEEKSKTNNCNWKILKLQTEDHIISLEFPLLEAGLILQVTFDKSSKIICLKTTEKLALTYQTKIKTHVNAFGYNFLKNLIKNQEEKLKSLEELPMFIDLFSGFAKRLVEAMNDALAVLKGCASAELRENILSFRINYYIPLTSCLVEMDLNELAMLGQPSISLRHEMGRVSEQTVRQLIPKPQRNLLQVFVKAVTNYTIDLEAKSGFVTKRPQLLF